MQPARERHEMLCLNLFNINEYVVPVLLVLTAAALVGWRWKRLEAGERHMVAVACAIPVVLLPWVTLFAPEAFLRYLIMAAPLGSLLAGWGLVRICGGRFARFAWWAR